MSLETIQHYKVKPERQEYLGERYFKFDFNEEKAIQVCKSTGDVKKGKSNSFGIYLISRLTFLTNYFAMGYLIPCTKDEYEQQFEYVMKILK